MRLLSFSAIWLLVLSTFTTARAQVPQPATTVQLPTFSVFTVQTTVSVPDSGGALLGGIGGGGTGSTWRGLGLLPNRTQGSARVASSASVSATIIDNDEIDRAVLAAAKRDPKPDAAATKAEALSKSVPRIDRSTPAAVARADSASALPGSVAAIREENRLAAEQRSQELSEYFAKARQAETDGKIGVAKIFYQMVARQGAGQLKQQAEARLSALSTPSASSSASR